MYLYEATTQSYAGDKYRFWSKNPYVLQNYTIKTDGGVTYHGKGYETEEQVIAASKRELKKFDEIGVGAAAWYTQHVERVEV